MNELSNTYTAIESIDRAIDRSQGLIGEKFSRWTVIDLSTRSTSIKGKRLMYWHCKCECGTQRNVEHYSLIRGKSPSCGCLSRERMTTHGLSRGDSKHHLYATWSSMKNRCRNPNHHKYKRYGGRGISVDKRWDDFSVFLKDMMPTWVKGKTLDRIDNNLSYSKENCRWATKIDQANNTNRNVFLTHKGKTLTISQWWRESNVPYQTFVQRIKSGWNVDEAISKPSGSRKSKIKVFYPTPKPPESTDEE